jgi:formylglycine-generating enzyme required for sulfatase activity
MRRRAAHPLLPFALLALAACEPGGASPTAAAKPSTARADAGARTNATRDDAGGGTDDAGAALGEAGGSSAPTGEVTTSMVNVVDTARPPRVVQVEPAVERPDFPPPAAGQTIAVPAGTLLRGSAPQDALRDQYAENDSVPTAVTAFEIDALPYPNDPARPFLTGVTRPEAEALCAEQGKRLCTEIEWEWACRGADNRRYPTGNAYDPSDYPDEDPVEPPSPTGAFAMGRLLEWTQSAWGLDPDQIERTAVRGFAPDTPTAGRITTPESGRRCAKRWPRQPIEAAPALGFRCCKGAVNAGACDIERPRPPFSVYTNMKPDKFVSVIRSIPELAMVHDNPRMFSDGDVRAVLARRGNDREGLAEKGLRFRWKPIRWIPRQGMELWVAVGRSDKHAFVVALHEVEDNERYVHASSLILWDQPLPLALAFREGSRGELFWAPCWGCRDGGTLEFDDETNQVIITHRW